MTDQPDGAVVGQKPPLRRCPTCRTTPRRIVGHGRTVCGWCAAAFESIAAGNPPGPAMAPMHAALAAEKETPC